VPALSSRAVRPLIALGSLGVLFVLYTQAVGLGLTGRLDLAVARVAAGAWQPALQPLMQAIAVLGGVEVTTVAAIALAVYLFRLGFRVEAAALLTLPVAEVLELAYKRLLTHPAPAAFNHPDGPSVVTIFHGGTLAFGGSYPSGHMIRTVLIYGLAAFVVRCLAPPGLARQLAVPLAAVMVGLMALDRIYLGVHWQSDVVGGLLLGGVALAGAITWLDRPRAAA
jgi:membrane-associated phospholipid phosphatase